ncbi:MAG TPA: oxaloacetate decarboxylase [Alphaproteobacteria bacterium]|nr:oxaloacetate decarboxylase [Alphaproteobacteria bacterium]
MTDYQSLKSQLAGDDIIVAPGCYDAYSAMMIAKAGFSVAYISGAGVSFTRIGRPDIGLVSMHEVAETVSAIAEFNDIPLVIDGDTGFGNALNVMRTVRLFERAGASAIQLEDQTMPKRCGHLSGKSLVPDAEMVGKIKAATDARRSDQTLIIGRTDAIAVEGFERALERAERYVEAGADVLFIEAPQTDDQMKALTAQFKGRVPLLANMVEGGKTPLKSAAELQALGYSLVIFPGGLIRAYSFMAAEYLKSLRENGTTAPYRNRMLDFDQLQEVLGTASVLEAGGRYDAENFEA